VAVIVAVIVIVASAVAHWVLGPPTGDLSDPDDAVPLNLGAAASSRTARCCPTEVGNLNLMIYPLVRSFTMIACGPNDLLIRELKTDPPCHPSFVKLMFRFLLPDLL
jgi:hypothetical protein